MKFLLNLLKSSEEKFFAKDKPFARFHPLYEATETFFFSPATRTSQAPYVRDAIDTKRYMSMVIVALVPVILFGIYNAGYQAQLACNGNLDVMSILIQGLLAVVPLIIVSYAVGGFWEVLFAIIRKHPINEGFLVTGILFPLVLPPTLPLWQAAVAISFGVVIGKEVFGGSGMNIFNPALVARAFCFFTYPGNMSGDNVWIAGGSAPMTDTVSGATPLAVVAAAKGSNPVELLQAHPAQYSFYKMFVGLIPGSVGETSALLCIVGALFLIICGVGSYRTMLGCVFGALGIGWLMNAIATGDMSAIYHLPPYYHMVMGGFAFGAVFMATDPVSSAATNTGKWIYGLLIGGLCVFIRVLNPAYPEGMMLAILFMNVFSPLIDYYVVKAHVRKRRRHHAQG
jgi:Na+-transporting NADH:ubiquinone oxidoreductase subunit B